MRTGMQIVLIQIIIYNAEMISETDVVYLRTGDNGVLSCNNMPGNTAIQWLRLNPSKTVTENTYTDGWTVNQEIPHHHRISIISSINSAKYELRIANVTKVDSGEYRCISVAGINAQPYDVQIVVEDKGITTPKIHLRTKIKTDFWENTTPTNRLKTKNETDFFDFTISTGIYDNPTNASNTSDTTTNSQINFNTDFLNNGIYWVVGMVGSGIVVFITVLLSYVYLKKLNDIVNNANQGHTISIEYREEQTNSIGNDNIEIYERSENVRENTHARSATRIERRTINNEVYEIVQQHESSQNIQMEHLTQDEGNRTYQTVSADLSNDDHIYKELSSGQC